MAAPAVKVTVKAADFADVGEADKKLLDEAFSALRTCMTVRGKCLGLLSLQCGDFSLKVIALSGNTQKSTFGDKWNAVNDKLKGKAEVAGCDAGRGFLLELEKVLDLGASPELGSTLLERIKQMRKRAASRARVPAGTPPTHAQFVSYLQCYRTSYLAGAKDGEIEVVADHLLDDKKAARLVELIVAGKDGVPEDVATVSLAILQSEDLLTDRKSLADYVAFVDGDYTAYSTYMKAESSKITHGSDLAEMFNCVAAFLDPVNQDPISTGKVFAIFSQCAEDNAAAKLVELVAKYKIDIKSQGDDVLLTWYSTHKAEDDASLEHKPLCPVCATVFEARLAALLEMVLA